MAAPVPSNSSAADVPRMWAHAVSQYQDLTATKLPHPASIQSIQQLSNEVLSAAERFQSYRHDGSKVDRIRSSVARCLGPLQQLGNLVTQATKTIYPPSEAIFAAMTYLISSATATSADYEALEMVFDDLQSQLHGLRILETRLSHFPELEVAVVGIFTSALVLCGVCTKYLRKKRIRKALQALISGRDEKLKQASNDFYKSVRLGKETIEKLILINTVDTKLATTSTLEHVVKIDGSSGQMVRQLTELRISQECQNVLDWLSKDDYLRKQRDILAKHHAKTGQWLLCHPSFRLWMDGDENTILWCWGIPGAGKTVMTARTIRHIEECISDANIGIAYVYCDYKTPCTAIGMISSIARQLAQQCSDLPWQVKSFYTTWVGKRSYPSQGGYISLIDDLSKNFAKAFVLVDALDECVEETRRGFLNILLASKSTLRLFFTSRRSVDLQDRFGVSSSIEIIASTSDIREYLATSISQNDRLSPILQKSPDLRDQIIDTVQTKAGGMFLLASLHLTHICDQNTARGVRDALRGLPRGIAPFYEQAMQRIADQGEEDRILAKKTLSFIFCAERSLKTAELLAALSVETGDFEFDDENCPNLSTVLGACVGLVRVDHNSGTIGLVHTTLQEYLQEHTANLLPDPHLEMMKVSIAYLSFRSFAKGPCDDEIALKERLQQYPFLEYASKNWGAHARYSDGQSLTSVLAFLGHGANLASSVQVLYSSTKRKDGWHSRYPDNFGPVHAAAYWGLEEACEVLCEEGYNIDDQDSRGTTALHLAAQQGHTTLLESLLARGARADLANEKGYTALIWAGRSGHTALITPLLLAHRNIWTHDVEGWTALDWAIIGGHYDAAKMLLAHYERASEAARLNKTLMLAAEAGNDEAVGMLLDKGADINGVDEEGSTALDFAVPEGKEKVVRLLLERGADPNSGDNYGHTALHWALAHPMIARLLLQYGATVDAQNQKNQTPLLWSAKEAQVDMLVLLIEAGAAVNTCDKFGVTALHAAAARGHKKMVEILLVNNADPTIEDRDGWMPVHSALIGGHRHLLPVFAPRVANCQSLADAMLEMLRDENNAAWLQEIAMGKSEGSVQVSGLRTAVNSGHSERILALISAGEDINACDSIGGSTALTLATWLGRLSITRTLIENGADIDRPDATGKTALHIAASDGYEDIAALLVSSGATVDKPLHSWTPLLLAIKDADHDCCARIAERLIENGASVKAADYHGRTALHWAAWLGQSLLAWELLQRGAPVDAQDRWGMTPLIWASASERTRKENPVTRLLLDANANVNMGTKDGYRAIHLAALAGELECLAQLLKHGADPEARIGTIGLKSLDIARIMKNEDAVKLLEEWGGIYSERPLWQHAQNMALISENGGDCTEMQGYRLLDINGVPNEIIDVGGLYQALRDFSMDCL